MGAVDVIVKDETTGGEVLGELALQLVAERVTIRELIDARVSAEVRAHNAGAALGPFRGLVQPTDDEGRSGFKRRPVDARAQVEVAVRAFERGHVLLLVDDRQRTTLDEEVVLKAGSSVTFLRLVPLVGG